MKFSKRMFAFACGILISANHVPVSIGTFFPVATAVITNVLDNDANLRSSVEFPAALSIIKTNVKKKDASKLLQFDFGIVANESVTISITAESQNKIPVEFTLSDGQTSTVEQPEKVDGRTGSGKVTKYLYTAEFDVALVGDELSRDISLTCIVDNGIETASLPIQMSLDNQAETNRLILDKKEPSISNMLVEYNDFRKQVTAKGYIIDFESGIKQIQYRWDDDQKWITYGKLFSNEPDASVYFEAALPYSTVEFMHILHIMIEDNAGNILMAEGEYCDLDNESDTQAPIITYIRLKTIDETALDKALHILSFGNYVNKPLELTVKLEDQSHSEKICGVKSVELLDYNGQDSKILQSKDSEDFNDGIFSFILEPDQIIDNWYIVVTDDQGFSDMRSISELLKSDMAKNVESAHDIFLLEEELDEAAMTIGIDWDELKSDRWIFDSSEPIIEPDYDNAIYRNTDSTYYYNNKGGFFSIDVEDNCSLEYVTISQKYIQPTSGEGVDEIIVHEIFTKETTSFHFEVDTLKADMKTGWYIYTVSATDHAAFLSETEHKESPQSMKRFMIFVDHELPEGSITVSSPAVIELNNALWLKDISDNDNISPVTFRLYAESKVNDLYKLSLDINGEDNRFEFTSDQLIIDDEGKTYVDVIINSNELTYNENNVCEVKAIIETTSRNIGYASLALHVDTENPVIDKFTVKSKAASEGTILNVLPFGVFSNDSIILTVSVSDGKYDSGVNHVTINYDGLSEPILMKEYSPGEYYCELDLDTKIFQSDIIVAVYDNMGKKNLSCPNIENTEREKGVSDNCFIMLETIAPTLIVDLPESDSSQRDDAQIWYRPHTNSATDSEKFIALTVQDVDSGIRYVEMTINGQSINPISGDMECNGIYLPTIESTEAIGRSNYKDLCKELTFYYSTDSIAANIPANEDGSYMIEIKVVDNAGNVTSSPVDKFGNVYKDSKIIYYRDNVEPSVVKYIFEPASYDNISEVSQDQFIEHLEYGYYFKQEFNLTIIYEDPAPSAQLETASLRLVPYQSEKLQAEEIHDIPIVDGMVTYTIPFGFKGQIYSWAYDKVGNVSKERTPQGFVIDDTAPTIMIEPLPSSSSGTDNNGNKIFTDDVQFRVTISDTQSGLSTISYSKSAELDGYDEKIITIENEDGYNIGGALADDWQIIETDMNLVTMVTRVFTFNNDDNDISMIFRTSDRAGNTSEPQISETFTIDTIAPQISIVNTSELINNEYYSGSTTFTIAVIERNFSPELMMAEITNSYTNVLPTVTFLTNNDNSSVHTAIVDFSEGDYEFSFSGLDLSGHKAIIRVNGEEASEYFYTAFNVDATNPKIQTNFGDFGEVNDREVYFNSDQIAVFTVTEHNFYESDMNIVVMAKAPGAAHTTDDKEWYSIGYVPDWKETGNDTYTLHIPFDKDGVYKISVNPTDRANNPGEFIDDSIGHTAVYEIDKTPPEYYARNDQLVADTGIASTPFYDVYDEKRKDEEPPTVEFSDINFDRIEIETIVYTPVYENGMELGGIVMSPLSEELSKSVTENKFTLTKFSKDGVYALRFVAIDKAGNRSEEISNTYFRMVDNDVLAYIYHSNSSDHTGYYSLMNENGKAISKKATDFDDLDILVIKPTENSEIGTLVLREDEKLYFPGEYSAFEIVNEAVSETATLVKMHLPGEYFSEAFRDDGLDTRMYLSVSIRGDVFLDLASIHIDNEAPTATLPDDFKNWHNYLFENEVTIVLTNISEILNDEASLVYECPRNEDRIEIPHVYDAENGTYSFTLSKGLHHIDIILVDEAGNEWNVDRVKYIGVGNSGLYAIGGTFLIVAPAAGLFIWRRRKV